MNKRKRLLLGLGIACGLHLFIALFLPKLATFLPQPLRAKIIEVNIVNLEGAAAPGSAAGKSSAASEQKPANDAMGKTNSTPVNNEEHSTTSLSREAATSTSEKITPSSSAASGSSTSSSSASGSSGTSNEAGNGDSNGSGRPGEGELATKPSLLSGGKNYPSAARSAGQQGTVLVNITINTAGRVASASLASSSGYPLLDNAAVNSVYSWTFRPAADPYGTPLSYTGVIPIEYSLN